MSAAGWKLILAGTVFNLLWLMIVIGQEQYIWIAGLILLSVWWLVPDSCLFSLTLAIPGIIMDSALTRFGVFVFADNTFPGWLIILWLSFATFVWSVRQPILQRSSGAVIVLGGIGGTLSYLAGARLEAVELPLGLVVSAGILLGCWFLFSTAALWWLERFHRQANRDVTA